MRHGLALWIALALLLLALPACGGAREMQANISPPAVVGRTIWWADQRASVYGGRERMMMIVCHEDGTPPCITFAAAEADAAQMRHWIRAVQTADRGGSVPPIRATGLAPAVEPVFGE